MEIQNVLCETLTANNESNKGEMKESQLDVTYLLTKDDGTLQVDKTSPSSAVNVDTVSELVASDAVVMTTDYNYSQIVVDTTDETVEQQVIYVVSKPQPDSQEGEEQAPLSFVAVVPGSEEQPTHIATETGDDGSLTYVALVPDSTHYAPPISSQEDDSSLTLKELTARERSKLTKRAQRQNVDFREKERVKVRKSMQDKRKDPAFREMERKKDRERRRLSRLSNNSLREKERARDREYKRRVKVEAIIPAKNTDDLEANSLESFMNDMDEKCQLLISCKSDDCAEEGLYIYKNNFDDDLQNTAFSGNSERADLIGQYGDSVLQSDIITDKDSENRTLGNYMPFIT